MVSKKNNKKGKDSLAEDPLDELNEIEDKTLTIERENDVFEELEIRDAESIPEYNSGSGFIKTDEIEEFVNKESADDLNSNSDGLSEDKSQDAMRIMDVIDEVDINNPDNEDRLDTKRAEQEAIKANQKADEIAQKSEELSILSTDNKRDTKKENINLSKTESDTSKSSDELVISKDTKKAPKIRVKPKLSHKNKKSNTKVVDNVKVDEDGVPLLNQFDTDKIKNVSFYPKLQLNKRTLTQISLILIGFLIIIYGIIQASEEVIKISDNVMYGEHASLSIGIIFLGILIIILAFYKEIINLFGLGNMYNTADSNILDEDDKNDKQ